MTGQPIGHARVSNFEQNPERQLEHVPVDQVFAAKVAGKCWAFACLDAATGGHELIEPLSAQADWPAIPQALAT